jgi:subtilisin family serine protease
LFYLKLNKAEDLNILENMAKENGITILGNDKYMPLWYLLSCSKESKGNAMQMANLFYESRLFASSQPDLMTDDRPLCVNDTYFANQWGLNNTGQSGGTTGMDIRYCQARNTTTGSSNIVIAVLDQGVMFNHPDLTNFSPYSFDTESDSSPSQVLGDHGTACAGIIGATANNNL